MLRLNNVFQRLPISFREFNVIIEYEFLCDWDMLILMTVCFNVSLWAIWFVRNAFWYIPVEYPHTKLLFRLFVEAENRFCKRACRRNERRCQSANANSQESMSINELRFICSHFLSNCLISQTECCIACSSTLSFKYFSVFFVSNPNRMTN